MFLQFFINLYNLFDMFTFHQYFILLKFCKRDVFSFTNLFHFINFNIIKIKYSNFVQLQVYQKRTCFNRYERFLQCYRLFSCTNLQRLRFVWYVCKRNRLQMMTYYERQTSAVIRPRNSHKRESGVIHAHAAFFWI